MPISVSNLIIQGASLEGENPLPIFRAREHDACLGVIEDLPEEKRELFGHEMAFRVLPYCLQDRYSRKRTTLSFKQITLENEHLKAVFLPELGGRLYSLEDKKTGKEILYKNPVFQPANLAIRNAWFSGGIEWNIGHIGHTFTTCSSVFAARVKDENGEDFLRLYEFERCKKMFWMIDFHLPSGSEVLYAHTRIVNPSDEKVPMYWWTNIAVQEAEGMRVFSPSEEVIFINPDIQKNGRWGFGMSRMPEVSSLPGMDCSYPENFNFSSEYFFQIPESEKTPWEAVVYNDGNMFFEASTQMLRYRKMFCWGNHTGGKRWQEHLSRPGKGYVEIQGGLAPTQLHGIYMPGHIIWEWTQVFGTAAIDKDKAHHHDWFTAQAFVRNEILKRVLPEDFYKCYDHFHKCSVNNISEILHKGSGWGALEIMRMQHAGEALELRGFDFEASGIGSEQQPWLELLKTGVFPEMAADDRPEAWMTQKEWEIQLKKSFEDFNNKNSSALLHYGIMLYERGCEEEAASAWKESLEKCPTPWVYRNISVLEKGRGNLESAVKYMEEALDLAGEYCDQAFCEEYISILIDKKDYRKAWAYYENLPRKLATAERTVILAAVAAFELNELDFVAGIFGHEYAVIREGEILLTELWFKYNAKIVAKERGISYSNELVEECRKLLQPPKHIDYRQG